MPPRHRGVISPPVVSRVFDLKDVVTRFEPDRNRPEKTYSFSNGRTFVKQKEYDD